MALAATDVDISSYYTASWSTSSEVAIGTTNGPEIAGAPQDGNQGTDITFGDWNGSYVEVGSDDGGHASPLTLSFSVVLPTAPTVNALLNTFFGEASDVDATVEFTNSLGGTATFSLVGDQTIRDYNNNVYTNDLQGYNTDSSYGDVTTQNWWNNYSDPSGDGHQRLDVATFVLPTSWAGTDLESMEITNPYEADSMTDDVLLSALQVGSVPEPGSFWLIVVGLFGLYPARYFRRVRFS
jgi:hypothetical protein